MKVSVRTGRSKLLPISRSLPSAPLAWPEQATPALSLLAAAHCPVASSALAQLFFASPHFDQSPYFQQSLLPPMVSPEETLLSGDIESTQTKETAQPSHYTVVPSRPQATKHGVGDARG